MKKFIPIFLISIALLSCNKRKNPEQSLNEIAKQYVLTVLEIGNYDNLYVDAYYGPTEWKEDVSKLKEENIPSERLLKTINDMESKLKTISVSEKDKMLSLRKKYMQKQLIAVKARVKMLSGEKYSFNEESEKLYDAVVPEFDQAYFENIIAKLEEKLPGNGDLINRVNKFKSEFVIAKEKLDAVFRTAIEESRRRTKKYINLPANENFKLEYVSDKAWAGYNWYKGNNFSLIQVNTDFPILIDRAIDLASHEGYPGHHVYNSLLETNMVKKRKWLEFSVYPLFSPQSLIAEGTANYGINVVFPKKERIKFEKEVLFPLAGLNVAKADLYYQIQELTHKLTYARTVAMRNYLDGKWDKSKTGEWLEKYALRKASESSFRFPETYRSYIINYNWGQDLVETYVESKMGENKTNKNRWDIFTYLISTPQVPSNLK
ncbi:MAG: hypothetical protein N4A49_02480 [Marinifilaceae bacterium]|jgi:hypothetical protein|nr:hypothetical protein [Marinifilaceae bacterium]